MDKRIEKTKEALTSSLFEMLETQPIENISITDLCNHANVSRRTFYVHYDNIYEIFEDYRDFLALKVYRALQSPDLVADNLLVVFDTILMSNYKGFRQLCLNDRHRSLIDDLHVMLFNTLCDVLNIEENDGKNRLILQYLSFGVINSYVYWFRNPDLMDYDMLTKTNEQIVRTNLELIKK
ncbi:TetR/AcrR family transcriptional regulator [Lentilactobacillus sp. Marseille-Q4993]|uniref:TetR/AcrR family transcriptional regulator n=1 Tax=Lentilactobacillus sp. Marseille-Q4993 TaxID=3039492 RepID=UPI0024BCFD42|nr:TetR/AcrR family transcriptional regulator [Lentilactobacillus sp. Marseille-Q4993]